MVLKKPGRLSRRVAVGAQAAEPIKLARVGCGRCEGTGGDPMTGGKCSPCSGRGIVFISEPYGQCKHCRGSGAEFNAQGHSTTMVCIVCRGKGVVHLSGPTRECGACGGTGRDSKSELSLPCVLCSGKGVVRVLEVQV